MATNATETTTTEQATKIEAAVTQEQEATSTTTYTTPSAEKSSSEPSNSSEAPAGATNEPVTVAATAEVKRGRVRFPVEGLPNINTTEELDAFLTGPEFDAYAARLSSHPQDARTKLYWLGVILREVDLKLEASKVCLYTALLPHCTRGLLSTDVPTFEAFAMLLRQITDTCYGSEFTKAASKPGLQLAQMVGLALKNKKTQELFYNQCLVRVLFLLCHGFNAEQQPPKNLMSWVQEYMASPPCALNTMSDALAAVLDQLTQLGGRLAPENIACLLAMSTTIQEPPFLERVGNVLVPLLAVNTDPKALQALCAGDCIENLAAGMRRTITAARPAFLSLAACLVNFATPLINAVDVQRVMAAGIIDMLLTYLENPETSEPSCGLLWRVVGTLLQEPTVAANEALRPRVLALASRDLVTLTRTDTVLASSLRALTLLGSAEGEDQTAAWVATPTERSTWIANVVDKMRHHRHAYHVINPGVRLIGQLLRGVPARDRLRVAQQSGARSYMKSVPKEHRGQILYYNATWRECTEEI